MNRTLQYIYILIHKSTYVYEIISKKKNSELSLTINDWLINKRNNEKRKIIKFDLLTTFQS